jgi:isoquinoline 1-oxidoreductase beta subunit
VARGTALPCRAGARRTEVDVVRLPVLTSPWRGLGAGPNVFAIECAIEECARACRRPAGRAAGAAWPAASTRR